MAVNWSGQQPVNFLGSYDEGYATGRGQAGERIISDAVSRYAENPLAAADQIARVDPRLGIGLRNDAEDRARAQTEQDREAATRGAQATANVVRTITTNIPDPEARRSAILHTVDVMGQRGLMTPEQVAQTRAEVEGMQWDDASVATFLASLEPGRAEDENIEINGVLVNRRTGKEVFRDPTQDALRAAQTRYYDAGVPLRDAQADRARRAPVGRASGGGRGGGATYSDVPVGARVVR